jgi:hypothetical protein
VSLEFDLDKFLEEYAPSQDLIEVTLPNGMQLTFKPWARLQEREDYVKEAVAWWKSLPKAGTKEAETHSWKDDLPTSAYEAVSAYLIHSRSVNPKISQLGALKMLRAAEVAKHIIDRIDAGNNSVYSKQAAAVTEAKKDLSGTGSGEPVSASVQGSGDATPANSPKNKKATSGS